MEQNLGFKQQLSQQQKLSYQMIQSINLLSIPTIELSEKIYEEVEKNPALEIVRDVSIENPTIKLNPSKKDYDTVSHSSDSDVFQSFLESSPSRNETLQENLLEVQVQIEKPSFIFGEVEQGQIVGNIIVSLDGIQLEKIPLVCDRTTLKSNFVVRVADYILGKIFY